MTNQLYFGDNLEVMRKYIASESVDLVYLDPPFNSKRNYSVIFNRHGEVDNTAQIEAFEDTVALDTSHRRNQRSATQCNRFQDGERFLLSFPPLVGNN